MLSKRLTNCINEAIWAEGVSLEELLRGALGGVIPAVVMVVVYFTSMAGRLAKIETNICWLIKELRPSQQHSKDRLV